VTGEFCSLDATGKRVRERTMGEMEQVRHRAVQEDVYDVEQASMVLSMVLMQLGCIRRLRMTGMPGSVPGLALWGGGEGGQPHI
jgi:hypothetical protein